MVQKAELKQYEAVLGVISTHLVAGKTVIHVVSDSMPDATFTEVSPDLEDVYFHTLKQSA